MTNYLTISIFLLFTACNYAEQKKNSIKDEQSPSEVKGIYPQEIQRKHLESFYNESKWVIYCIHCDERCRFYKKLNIVDSPFLGSLDLRFNRVEFFNDTTELRFSFYYKDTVKCDVNTVYNYGTLTYGTSFKGNRDSVIYFLSETTVQRFSEKGKTSRYETPLQPEVVAFIKNNKDSLNPWFREEAKRRKIIE
jgi:hypothetical protein